MDHLKTYKDYTFGKGIQGDLQIDSFTFDPRLYDQTRLRKWLVG